MLARCNDRGLLNLFDELEGFGKDFGFFFDGGSWNPQPVFPKLDAWADEEGVKVSLDIPGYDPSDIEINVKEDTLTIKGSQKNEDAGEGEEQVRRESRREPFERKLNLGFVPNGEDVVAEYKNGVLTLTAKRPESAKPRRIEIKTS